MKSGAKMIYFKKKLISRLQRELGFDRLTDNTMSVLDSAVDITKCKPAVGKLRDIQLADSELLRLFDLLCAKNGFTYWLDWGTLLGAVRHKGFIPWDDDLDVCMPREDYMRAIPVIADFFLGHEGFEVSESESAIKNGHMWVSYWKASVLIDIYPIDSVAVKKGASNDEITLQVISCRTDNDNLLTTDPDKSSEQFDKVYYYASNVWGIPGFFPMSAVFPLKKLLFEQWELNVPNDYEYYLSVQYGNFMAFPRNGIQHHRGLIDNKNFTPEALQTALQEIKKMQLELLN